MQGTLQTTTTFSIEGYRITEYKGLVRGIVVRSPTISQGSGRAQADRGRADRSVRRDVRASTATGVRSAAAARPRIAR